MPQVNLLAGTRKGAFIQRADRSRRQRETSDSLFLGNIICALSGG